MAQSVGTALLGAAGTAFLASPGPVSRTAPSLRGGAALPGDSSSAGMAGTAALASLAGETCNRQMCEETEIRHGYLHIFSENLMLMSLMSFMFMFERGSELSV